MRAQYPGKCVCGVSFPPGTEIEYDRGLRKATQCPYCRPAPETADEDGVDHTDWLRDFEGRKDSDF